jgi:hypothetical protein
MVTIYKNQEELDWRNILQVFWRGEVHIAVLVVISDFSGQIGCTETSETYNQHCVTSQKSEDLIYTAAEAINHGQVHTGVWW